MTRERDRDLRDYMNVSPKPSEVDRGWRRISKRLTVSSHSRSPAIAVAFAMIAIVVIWIMPLPWAAPQSVERTTIETQEQSQAVLLPDGSEVTLGPQSCLLLVKVSERDVRLELSHGVIDVSATHRADRTFTVGAGRVDVRVVGTKFHVEVGDATSDVAISVSEGRVRIDAADDLDHPRFLSAGESWSSQSVPPPVVATASAEIARDAGAPRVAARTSLSPQFQKLYRDGRYVEAFAMVRPDFSTRCTTAPADDLFTLAETARLSGNARDAATAFDALRTRYRADPRAPLAALELGRLDLDELSQPRAAKLAFDDAITLQPDGFFREDADARRVQAIEAAGDHEECVIARLRYLDAYPQGSHRASVAKRCP